MEPNRPCGRGGYGKMYDHGCSAGNANQNSCYRGACDKQEECRDENPNMRKMRVGMAYVPMQEWDELYDPATALCQGTAFPDLNLVFCGVRGNR